MPRRRALSRTLREGRRTHNPEPSSLTCEESCTAATTRGHESLVAGRVLREPSVVRRVRRRGIRIADPRCLVEAPRARLSGAFEGEEDSLSTGSHSGRAVPSTARTSKGDADVVRPKSCRAEPACHWRTMNPQASAQAAASELGPDSWGPDQGPRLSSSVTRRIQPRHEGDQPPTRRDVHLSEPGASCRGSEDPGFSAQNLDGVELGRRSRRRQLVGGDAGRAGVKRGRRRGGPGRSEEGGGCGRTRIRRPRRNVIYNRGGCHRCGGRSRRP